MGEINVGLSSIMTCRNCRRQFGFAGHTPDDCPDCGGKLRKSKAVVGPISIIAEFQATAHRSTAADTPERDDD